MAENNLFSKAQFKNLSIFLEHNKHVEIAQVDLQNAEVLSGFDWQKLDAQNDETIEVIRAYQRLKKIMPELEHARIIALLRAGLHSALQIAAQPKIKFLHKHGALLGEDLAVVEQFYDNALAIRSQVLLEYMEIKQSNEPHVSSAKI